MRRFSVRFYLAHCTREKGLFDTLDGVALATAQLAAGESPLCIHLVVAGLFPRDAEESEHRNRARLVGGLAGAVEYAGFVGGEREDCPPPGVIACLLPDLLPCGKLRPRCRRGHGRRHGCVLSTRFGARFPELLPADYPGFVAAHAPAEIAAAVPATTVHVTIKRERLRTYFLEHYTQVGHVGVLRMHCCGRRGVRL